MVKTPGFLKDLLLALTKEFSEPFCKELSTLSTARFQALLEENVGESKVMRQHTVKRIYPAVAVFHSLLELGVERERAASLIKEHYRLRSEKAAKKLRMLMKIPFLHLRVPTLFANMTKKNFGEAAGFKAEFLLRSKRNVKFDIITCPYFDLCRRYACPELVEMYCDADDICYGNMHSKVLWHRTQTLGKGGTLCDFEVRLKVKKK